MHVLKDFHSSTWSTFDRNSLLKRVLLFLLVDCMIFRIYPLLRIIYVFQSIFHIYFYTYFKNIWCIGVFELHMALYSSWRDHEISFYIEFTLCYSIKYLESEETQPLWILSFTMKRPTFVFNPLLSPFHTPVFKEYKKIVPWNGLLDDLILQTELLLKHTLKLPKI